MKLFLAWLFLAVMVLAAPTGKDARLDALKKQFPGHVAGKVTEKSDPAIQRCWNKYHDRVAALTMNDLAKELYELQEDAASEFFQTASRVDNWHGVLTSAGVHAERQNASWLKQKLIPYLKRLVQFQQGR